MLKRLSTPAPLEARFNSKSSSLTGFSLIELIIVIAVIGVLAVMAITRMANMPVMRMDMAAKTIQSDMRYIQSLAISTQKRTEIYFRADQDDYSAYIENTPGNWTLLTHTLTRQDFQVQLNSGEFMGVDLTLVYFNDFDRALVFDKWGSPYSYNIGTGSATPLVNPAYVTLTAGLNSKNIRVERGTGRVYITE